MIEDNDFANRPIGYWLKHLDGLIESSFDRELAAHGLTRRHWQLLNTIAAAPASVGKLEEALGLFIRNEPGKLEDLVEDLTGRVWVGIDGDGRVELTAEGRLAHAAVKQDVQQIRGRLAAGISDSDYLTTVATLGRMVANLEPTSA
jgi:DNA-binding MarR family transcriptional regulator